MSGIKVFRPKDQKFDTTRSIFTVPVVNAGYSKTMGAGFCTFENCASEHTVKGYDEILYIVSGSMSLRQGDKRWRANAGDMLWIPADTKFVYEAKEKCTTFYSTCPLQMSGSTKRTDVFPEGQTEVAT